MSGQTDKFRREVMAAAQNFADASAAPAFVTLPDAKHVYLNQAFKDLRNDTLETSILPLDRVFGPESLQAIVDISHAATGATTAELIIISTGGEMFEADFRIALARDEDGQLLVYGNSVYEKEAPSDTAKQISQQLRKATTSKVDEKRISLETQIFRFAERSSDGLLVLDQSGVVTYVNSTLERLFDLSRDEMLGKELHHFVSPTNPAAFERRVSQRIYAREGGTQTIETKIAGLGRREISFRWYPISESPRSTGFVINDVTTQVIRRRARHALAMLTGASESPEIIEGLRQALHADRVVLVSLWKGDSAEPTIDSIADGSQEPVLPDVLKEHALKSVHDYLENAGTLRHDHQLCMNTVPNTNEPMLFRAVEDVSGRVEGFIVCFLDPCPDGWQVYEEVFADFTRRVASRFEFRRKSREIVERRKRESLEQLAHGIAHDFNNVLMSIYGHLQLMDRKLKGTIDEGLDRNLAHAIRSAERATQLVKVMITYSENALPSMVTIDLSQSVESLAESIRKDLSSKVELRMQCESEAFVLGDPATLYNAIEALILNANDAIAFSDADKGQISVEVRKQSGERGQSQISLVVSDNGSGMSDRTKERVFDPFFTTRGPGGGVGLGLAVVQATVARMHGTIDLSSREGRGTIVSITFPCSQPSKQSRPIRDTDSFRQSDTARLRAKQAKHILVVDDASEQRELIVECLRDEGYSTEDVANGKEAVSLIESRAGDFDLVIMDRLMPSLSGDKAAASLVELAPRLPIIILSGFVDPDTRERLRAVGVAKCLQKPVGIADLMKAIDEILKSKHSPSTR